jgi:formylglycine-generating enzyme required for sulfatase activity
MNPAGGVMVWIETDGSLARSGPYTLSFEVLFAGDGGRQDHSDNPARLPTRVLIVSNGDPSASVTVSATLTDAMGTIDSRSVVIQDVPTDRITELAIVLSSTCSCQQSNAGAPVGCASPINASGLPPFDASAPPDAQCAASENAGDDSGAVDAATPDATLSDASLEGGAPDGDADASGSGSLDAPCVPSCSGLTPFACDETGSLQKGDDCLLGMTHCVAGKCEPVPRSCQASTRGAAYDCGGGGTIDCCAIDEVPGGTFYRNYDGMSYSDKSHPATISSFRLDRFEITVGRFRQFVAAVEGGWLPPAGLGKHAHLNGGRGLVTTGDSGAPYETGWDPAWNAQLPISGPQWDMHLTHAFDAPCDPATWTTTPGDYERLPINCIDWYDAYAFCIWDADPQMMPAFLPSAAEWNYAAAGGSEQRVYAWGNNDPGNDTMLAIWGNYFGQSGAMTVSVFNIAPVGSAPAGNGKWGQSDLTGNLFEWNLDLYPDDAMPCTDCDDTTGHYIVPDGATHSGPILRGGAFNNLLRSLPVSQMLTSPPAFNHSNVGARCARVP